MIDQDQGAVRGDQKERTDPEHLPLRFTFHDTEDQIGLDLEERPIVFRSPLGPDERNAIDFGADHLVLG